MSGLLALAYDAETSDIPLWNYPSDHPDQPHIVELAGVLATREDGIVSRFHRKIRSDGWRIGAKATEAHGVTTEMAMNDPDRIPEDVAIAEFLGFWRIADFRIAHNESFDARIIRIGCKRFMPKMAEDWSAGKARCTADLSEPICKLPPTQKMIDAGRGNQFKRPKLEEAYRILIGTEIPRVDGTHGAMVDAEAALAIYLKLHEAKNANRTP